MRIPRLFHPASLRNGDTVVLDQGAARHARTVLRLAPGQEVELFDGDGGACRGVVVHGPGRGLSVNLTATLTVDREPSLAVEIGLGISRGERMDLAIQKSVELGAKVIHPLVTGRSVVRLDAVRAGKRLAHWNGIVHSACGQCGRNRLPLVMAPARLDEWLAQEHGGALCLVPTPGADRGLRDMPPPGEAGVRLLIGPEGGLDESERHAAAASGFVPVRLGPRVLRTETAAMAALTAVMVLWGDLG